MQTTTLYSNECHHYSNIWWDAVVDFYKNLGFESDPQGIKCAQCNNCSCCPCFFSCHNYYIYSSCAAYPDIGNYCRGMFWYPRFWIRDNVHAAMVLLKEIKQYCLIDKSCLKFTTHSDDPEYRMLGLWRIQLRLWLWRENTPACGTSRTYNCHHHYPY